MVGIHRGAESRTRNERRKKPRRSGSGRNESRRKGKRRHARRGESIGSGRAAAAVNQREAAEAAADSADGAEDDVVGRERSLDAGGGLNAL